MTIARFTSLTEVIKALPRHHGTPTSDLVKTYLGLITQGTNDFEAINNVRNDEFFHQALGTRKPYTDVSTLFLTVIFLSCLCGSELLSR